jgi:hypothetical protein
MRFGLLIVFGCLLVGCAAHGKKTALSPMRSDSYRIQVSAPETMVVGSNAPLEVRLTTSPPYTVTQGFPLKLVLKGGKGIASKPSSLGLSDADLTERMAILRTTLSAIVVGQHRLNGVYSFSICDNSRCVEKRVKLEIPLEVR